MPCVSLMSCQEKQNFLAYNFLGIGYCTSDILFMLMRKCCLKVMRLPNVLVLAVQCASLPVCLCLPVCKCACLPVCQCACAYQSACLPGWIKACQLPPIDIHLPLLSAHISYHCISLVPTSVWSFKQSGGNNFSFMGKCENMTGSSSEANFPHGCFAGLVMLP